MEVLQAATLKPTTVTSREQNGNTDALHKVETHSQERYESLAQTQHCILGFRQKVHNIETLTQLKIYPVGVIAVCILDK